MKTSRLIIAAFASVLLVFACNKPNQELIENAPMISQSFTDGYGRVQVLSRIPSRVVSLSAAITEICYAIGAQDRLAAVSHDSDFPKDASSKPYIITYPDFDLPEVAVNSPDLVLASTEIHDARISEYFDRYNIPLHFFNQEKMSDIFESIRTIGKMTGASEKANHLADSLSKRSMAIADSTKGQIKYNTVMVLGISPITVVGSKSFLNDLIAQAGGKNAFENLPEKYPSVTAEQFIQSAPEYVLVLTHNDKAWNDLIAAHPEIHSNIPATEKGHIFQVEPEILVRPGPRIVEGLAYITRILHPAINTN